MRKDIFCENDNVLIVGEGNFSFAVDLVELNVKNIKITATCYEPSIAFESGIENSEYLKKFGARVSVGVDATKLSEYFSESNEKFDKIIFNFPHAGGKMKINRNRDLIRDFFVSAQSFIDSNGIVLVSLCNGQGGTPADIPQRRWDDSWQIVEMAAHGNFLLTKIEPFLIDNFPGYVCVGYRSLEKGFCNKNSLVHFFRKVDQPDSINIALRTDFKDFLREKEMIQWKEFVAKFSGENVIHKSDVISVYPLCFSFDITFSVDANFYEDQFYATLYRFAGNIVDNVEFLGSYEFPESHKVTRTYKISYKSYSLPLYRSRVIDLHKNLVSKILEDYLNVVVTR